MNAVHNIERLYRVIENSLFMITGQLNYDRITEAITRLANTVADFDGDTMDIWDIGEGGASSVLDLIVGAYWHYTEWHSGQWSPGYAALSALGQVFNPGMTWPELENEAYRALDDMARKENQT